MHIIGLHSYLHVCFAPGLPCWTVLQDICKSASSLAFKSLPCNDDCMLL